MAHDALERRRLRHGSASPRRCRRGDLVTLRNADELRRFARQDWVAAQRDKELTWRDWKRHHGPAAGIRIADELRKQVLAQSPAGQAKKNAANTSPRTSASSRPSTASRPAAVALLADLAPVLRRRRLRGYVFGAHAAVAYGRTRRTADVDVTVDLAQTSTLPGGSLDLHARARVSKELLLYPGCRHGLDPCRDALNRDLSG